MTTQALSVFRSTLKAASVFLMLFSPISLWCQSTPEGRPCGAEPTDMTVAYGDLVTCNVDVTGDSDTFRFSGSSGDTIVVQAARSSGGTPCIELFNPSGTRIGVACSNFGARIDSSLTVSGTYAILITEQNNDTTAGYTLSLERIRTPSDAAVQIQYAQTLSGEVNPVGDLDLYFFGASSGDTIVLQAARTGGGTPCIELFNPAGTRMSVGCSNFGARIDSSLTVSGTYAVLITEQNNDATTAFTLSLERIRIPSDSAVQIQYGQTLGGEVNPVGDLDLYFFGASSGDTIVLQAARTGGGTPCVELFNPAGTRMNVTCSNFGARIDSNLTVSGTYAVLITEQNNDATAVFALSLERIRTPSDSAVRIQYGQTLGGEVNPVGDLDLFFFTGSSGDTIVAQAARSGGGTPCIELFNSAGARMNVACSNFGARIDTSLPVSGTYAVLATEQNNDATVGYSLSLQCTAGICQNTPGLTLTSLSPNVVFEAEPSFTLTVSGSGLDSGAVVLWNNSPRATTFLSATQVQARILTSDVLNPGSAQVSVLQAGVTSNSLSFTVAADNAPPIVTQVLPPTGPTQGNTKCIVLGDHFKPSLATTTVINPISQGPDNEAAFGELDHFQSDDNAQASSSRTVLYTRLGGVKTSHEGVFFGGLRVGQVVFVNRMQLEVTTPPNPAGSTEVQVVQHNGSAGLPDAYTYKTLPPVPAVQPSKRRYQIPFVVDNPSFRTNLGINNLGNATVTVDLLLAENNGLLLAQKVVTVPARGMKQLNNVIRELEEASGLTGREGYLLLDSTETIGVWASQIDNVSLDPSMEIGREERHSSNKVLLPSSVSSGRFLTSLIVVNTSDKAGTVTIRVRDGEGNLRLLVSSQPIAARGYFFFGDFYKAAGLSNVFGPIELESSEGLQLQATERIFTQENTSAYFEGVDLSQGARRLVLPYAVDTVDFRTNLGINNPGSMTAQVRVTLIGKDGLAKGSLTETVPPNGLKQINDINRRLLNKGEVTGEEGTLRLESDQPIVAWTSQIDNQTQDPSLVVGKPSTATRLLIPSTTSVGNFKSTLAVVNLGTVPASVQITARDNDGNLQNSSSVTIPAEGLLSYSDIRSTLNLGGTFGPLEIISQGSQPLLAVSRVYSNQRTGGYFEGVSSSE